MKGRVDKIRVLAAEAAMLEKQQKSDDREWGRELARKDLNFVLSQIERASKSGKTSVRIPCEGRGVFFKRDLHAASLFRWAYLEDQHYAATQGYLEEMKRLLGSTFVCFFSYASVPDDVDKVLEFFAGPESRRQRLAIAFCG